MINKIDKLAKGIGNIVSYLILAIVAVVTYEVVARYWFNSPTSWAWLINKQIFGVYVMIAGSYALLHNMHIRIEILYERYPKWFKRFVHWATFFAAVVFLGSLCWKSGVMGLQAWDNKELAMGVFKLPLYPLKLFMPIGAALFILVCITNFLRHK